MLQIRAAVVDDNLAHAFPELSPRRARQLARRMWEHLFLLVLEVAHAPRKIHETNWRDYISSEERGRCWCRMLLDDRPLLIITAHFGNFEVAGYVLGMLGFPTYTVARTLDNPYLDRFVNRFRGGTGQYIIPKNGGYDQIVAVLGARRHDDVSGRPVRRTEGLLGRVLRPAGLGPQGDRAVGPGERRPGGRVLSAGGWTGPCTSSCSRRHGRSRQSRRRGGHGQRLTQWYTSRLEEIIRRDPTSTGGCTAAGKTPGRRKSPSTRRRKEIRVQGLPSFPRSAWERTARTLRVPEDQP